MRNLAKLSILLIPFSSGSLIAFDARYTPSEATVSWPIPEDAAETPAFIFAHPQIANASIMVGDVDVGGTTRPFLAKLDASGNVDWSRRLPFSSIDNYDNLSLAGDTHLIGAVQVDEGGALTDYVGSFNPSDGFSARYTKSLPALAPDPFNPFAGGRSFQAQRGGKMAIVELAGSDVSVLMLNESAGEVFAQTYALPSGGDVIFPGFGLTYSFVAITELENGDFYLTTSGVDFASGITKAIVVRLNSNGSILWQRTIDIPGSTAFLSPRGDDSVLVFGIAFGVSSVETPVVLLNDSGQTQFSISIPNGIFNGFSFSHFAETGNILLQGSIADEVTQDGFTADGATIILSDTGEIIAEAAYDLGENDSIFHIGTINGSLYFELFGFQEETGLLTHGVLARSDANLDNWIARSYLDVVGPSANFSAFFATGGSPYLTYRDDTQNAVNVSKLDSDLQEIGECDVLSDVTIVPYDPNFTITDISPTVSDTGITASTWDTSPTLTDASFALEPTPFDVEFVCGSGGGETSKWDNVESVNEEGDKQTDIGWINDRSYPYVWHHEINGWLFIAPVSPTAGIIVGYNIESGFWFATSNDWAGWYYNLDNPGWSPWE